MFKIGFGRNWRDRKKAEFLKREVPPMQFEEIAKLLEIPKELINSGCSSIVSREAALSAEKGPVCAGRLIDIAMNEQGFSQADLARMLRVSRAHVSYLIHGQRQFSAEQAAIVGGALGIPAYLILRLQADYELYTFYKQPTDAEKLKEV